MLPMKRGPQFKSSDAWQLLLLRLRYRDSHILTLSSDQPFWLDADNAWVIYSGVVDIFAVRTEAGGRRDHFFRAYADQLLLGTELRDKPFGLLAVCAPDTQVLKISQSRLKSLAQELENADLIVALLDDWIRSLASGVAVNILPKTFEPLQAGEALTLAKDHVARNTRSLFWIEPLDGDVRFMGRDDLPALGGVVPIPETAWIEARQDSHLNVVESQRVFDADPEWTALDAFYSLVLDMVALNEGHKRQIDSALIDTRLASDQGRIATAVSQLASTWRTTGYAAPLPAGLSADSQEPLLAACRVVGDALGVAMQASADLDTDPFAAVSEIARASQLRYRFVLLLENWWHDDNGPLLAFRGEDHHPVALLMSAPGRYVLNDLVSGERLAVNAQIAAELDGSAFMFYRRFPEHVLTLRDLLAFGIQPVRGDVWRGIAVGLAGGALGVLIPIMIGVIFDTLLPAGDRSQLVLAGVVLGAAALSAAFFQFIREMTLLRLQSWTVSGIQSAIWDRLLSLPADFFRGYAAGDLVERAMGITQIQQLLSNALILALLSGIFSIFNFVILFAYDAQLALIVTGFMAILAVITGLVFQRSLQYQRQVTTMQGEISGLVAQLVTGVTKLRVAGAEGRSFALWAEAFGKQKKLAYRTAAAQNIAMLLINGSPIVASMIVFAVMASRTDLSTGTFLAFNAALVLFLTAMLQLSAAVITAVGVVPLYERLKPILDAQPEIDQQKAAPGELNGAIEISHVSFRYAKESPLVLDNLSLSVHSGEFVALVGQSGSGKSSLLRLLLGFETPEAGAIYYSGLPLNDLDVRAVRRQIGVVLQHGQVMTGSIYSNIVGASRLTVEDAWEAARLAGIADDIKDMPMGMQTVISEGGSTFSGGQRQRLMIARALVTRPRIIFFDEATSALDDQSQAIVTASLKQSAATRIVIAHRLSTVIDAERILVIAHGKIAESGTYKELMLRNGLFAELAKRQLA